MSAAEPESEGSAPQACARGTGPGPGRRGVSASPRAGTRETGKEKCQPSTVPSKHTRVSQGH